MKNVLLLILWMAMLSISCKNNNEEMNTLSFHDFLENYQSERYTYFPLEATYAGIDGYNDQFPNFISERYRDDLRSFFQKYIDDLANYDVSRMNELDKMSYDVLKWECELGLEGLKHPTHLLPVDQMWSVNLTFGQFAGGTSAQPFASVQDYENWLKRTDGFTAWAETAIENMRKGIEKGIVLPAALVPKVIPQWESLAQGPVEDHLYFSPAKSFPDSFSTEEQERLKNAFYQMVKEKIIPINTKMANFLRNEYLPAARSSSGISALPNGNAYYDYTIRLFTTTNLSADSIFELGKSEVARIRSEMEKVKNQVGFKGDLKAFFDEVRSKKELMPYTDPQQVIDNFKSIHERMKPQVNAYFELVPKTPFEVRRTEAFREASASAEYSPGSVDGSRPGIFYVPIPDVREYNVFSDETLFLHEAIPGHHYQISLQQENVNLPTFRKSLWSSAYGEGWALYCETLGDELGLYTDPYQYFGHLGMEMHRAIRLVVDAGIHTKGWTREEAIQYSLENEAEGEASIIAEIERYMAMPGQALSYKIGQLKIIELRQKAQNEMGEAFDIRKFHNKVLETGCIPLQLLENKIDEWIANN
jgi:uncharacterized protein (DUF885 family)